MEELVDSCSEFLSGSTAGYISFLASQGIKTITDLGVAVIEDDFANGIIPGSERAFSSKVLEVVAGSQRGRTIPEIQVSQEEEDAEIDKQIRKKLARDRVKSDEAKTEAKRIDKNKSVRYYAVKVAKETVDRLNRVIEAADKNIDEQKLQLVSIIPKLRNTMKHLKDLRSSIASIKGNGLEEDVNFHIDKNRDIRGFTYLMIASQVSQSLFSYFVFHNTSGFTNPPISSPVYPPRMMTFSRQRRVLS